MLYRIDRNKVAEPKPVTVSTLKSEGWSEKDLEDYLFENLPKLVGTDLLVIGQSSPYQPEVDLLALDSEGDLWFFELKAVRSTSQNLLQVLRYSQSYSSLSVDALSQIYEKFTKDSTKSLAVAFCDYFGYNAPSAAQEWGGRIGRKHHLMVVTDGADDETIDSVNHWQRHGLDIDIWPYRVYPGDSNSFQLELPEIYVKGRRISGSVPGVFVVNTDRRHDRTVEPYMLTNEVAMALVEEWMRKINRVTSGSRVLLYGNGVGIIAIGIATPERKDGVFNGSPMRTVKLRDFKRLKTPMKAGEIRKTGQKEFVFMPTVFQLSEVEGDKIWEAAKLRT